MTPANGATMRFLAASQQHVATLPGSSGDGRAAALKRLFGLAFREAQTLASADAFMVIMLAFVVATALVPLLRNVDPFRAPSTATH